MAADAWHPTDPVTASDPAGNGQPGIETAVPPFPPEEGVFGALFRHGSRFDFFQAVRLLEIYFPEAPGPGETSEVRRERIRLRPDAALVFPAADIKRVVALEAKREEERVARVEVTFMGLYGVASPLPVYFYEDLASGYAETEALRDFLDIFNHRLYAYFYRAWKKYRPALRARIRPDEPDAERYLATAGHATGGAVQDIPLPNPMRVAAFACWLSPRVRHAEGLQKLLAAVLRDIPVAIQENVLRSVRIPNRPRMGEEGGGFGLGSSAVIGARVKDVSGKFRVRLGPMSFAAYRSFLPGAARAVLLDFAVRLYAPDYLDYDVELQLDTSQIPPTRLGDTTVQLGLTTWLGKPSEPVISHHVSYA